MPRFVMLWTDATVWALVAFTIGYGVMVGRSPNLKANWRKVFRDAPALCSSLILALCLLITMADSVHYRPALKAVAGSPTGSIAYDSVTRSSLDWLLSDLVASREVTYSRPLDYLSYRRDTVTPDSAATVTSVHSAARHGMSPSWRQTLAAVSTKPARRARASRPNSASAQATASSAPSPSPVPPRDSRSAAHWCSGSDRWAPPCSRRGETRCIWPLTDTVSRR